MINIATRAVDVGSKSNYAPRPSSTVNAAGTKLRKKDKGKNEETMVVQHEDTRERLSNEYKLDQKESFPDLIFVLSITYFPRSRPDESQLRMSILRHVRSVSNLQRREHRRNGHQSTYSDYHQSCRNNQLCTLTLNGDE